jgi:hypothetical protein
MSGTVQWQEYRISWVGVKQIHAAMPRPEGATPRASGTGEQGRITPAAQFTGKSAGSAGSGQTEVEIHATAMPRPEEATPRANSTGEQGRITPAAQFTDKGGARSQRFRISQGEGLCLRSASPSLRIK